MSTPEQEKQYREDFELNIDDKDMLKHWHSDGYYTDYGLDVGYKTYLKNRKKAQEEIDELRKINDSYSGTIKNLKDIISQLKEELKRERALSKIAVDKIAEMDRYLGISPGTAIYSSSLFHNSLFEIVELSNKTQQQRRIEL